VIDRVAIVVALSGLFIQDRKPDELGNIRVLKQQYPGVSSF